MYTDTMWIVSLINYLAVIAKPDVYFYSIFVIVELNCLKLVSNKKKKKKHIQFGNHDFFSNTWIFDFTWHQKISIRPTLSKIWF